ncbi:MAG: hypothetical protein NTX82_05610 [Candidatus Parcubacteria bacterium]|nr:hypothetical protein [Candidatus Parcubacteria bacterium]
MKFESVPKKKKYEAPTVKKIEFKSDEDKESLDKVLVSKEVDNIKKIINKSPEDLKGSILVERLFPINRDKVTPEVFERAFNKLMVTKTELSAYEKAGLFRKALEYFGKERAEEYPIGHACGSEALKGIIAAGEIIGGGTGEVGEASGMARSGKQRQNTVSVAEMNHPSADYVEALYAKLGASKEVIDEVLSIDADKLDNKGPLDDFINIYLANASLESVLESLGRSVGKSPDEFAAILKKEIFKNESITLTKDLILNSPEIKSFILNKTSESVSRKHYKTFETEKRDHEAYTEILNKMNLGQFPEVTFQGRVYSDPWEIINLNHGIRIPRNPEEKTLIELQTQYAWYLKPYSDPDKPGVKQPANFVLPEDKNSAEYQQVKENLFAAIKGEIQKNLEGLLYPFDGNSEQGKKNRKRLEELSSQYPCIFMAEGKSYRDKGLTYTQKEGQRPVPFIPAEERILSNIPLEQVTEIMVPYKKTTEVMGLLIKKFGTMPEDINIVPMEFLEIKRLIGHQL